MIKKIAKYTLFIFRILLVSIIFLGGGFGNRDKTVFNNGEALVFAHCGVSQ